jgi:hypothetical protein
MFLLSEPFLCAISVLAVTVAAFSIRAPIERQSPAASAPAQDAHVTSFADFGLTLTMPEKFIDLRESSTPGSDLKDYWHARLGAASLSIYMYVHSSETYRLTEPDDGTANVLDNLRDPRGGDPSFAFEKTLLVPGAFGYAPYISIAYGAMHKFGATDVVGTVLVATGLLKDSGYAIEAIARPALSDDDVAVVLDFFKHGIAYTGEVRVSKWTDEEAKARWMRDAPPSTHKHFKPVARTEHYIVLSNSGEGAKFGEKMEASYALIKKTFPFEEVPGRRLMPVFLFVTPDEYYEYFADIAKITKAEAARSGGHSSRDYYATWFKATGDPVHIHEGTHQVFQNRLHLHGGGSWFQEGVAEYMSTTPNDRNIAARLVRTGKHMPLADFVRVPSLLYSAKTDVKGGDAATDQYIEAALFIEFLHDSKWSKDKFQDAIHALGLAPRSNVPAIERAFNKVFGTDIAGVERQWIEYCKTRK